MSANFNIAMLRSIQQPLAESMEAIIAQLTRLMAGQIQGNELDQGQHAKLVRGSLEMIGCQAISRLAATLERGCDALAFPDRRGWDQDRVDQIAKSLLLLAEGLDDQIKHMLVDNEDLPVRLWPVWAHVFETMGEPAPSPEDLFEPDPNFEDEKFQPLAIDYLAQVCEGMNERLAQALAQLDAARDGAGVAKSLREAERVFNWAYGLRHRRGYQAYWLVMRARMAIGLIQDPAQLEDKASWTVLLNESSIELQKFAKDALRVRPDLLLKVIRPLLTPWPQSWTSAHPALEEMDSRMGLSVFWKTVSEVQDQKLQLAVSQFVAHQDELLSLLANLRSEWTRYVSGEGRASDPQVARAHVVNAVSALTSKKMLFSDPSAIIMLEAISRISEKMPGFDAVSEEMALEFASSVLVVEDSVERRGRVSPEFHEQSRTQQKRLAAAWDGNRSELAALPLVRWDAKKQERQTRQALSIVFQEIRKDLTGVEEVLVENFRGSVSRPAEQSSMMDTLSLADAVLRMLMCGSASRVVRALNERLSSMPAAGALPAQVQDEITLGITGLTSFLAARESGDEDAENLLATAVRALLGEPLRKEVDPAFLVPPPEQNVAMVAEIVASDAPSPEDEGEVLTQQEEDAAPIPASDVLLGESSPVFEIEAAELDAPAFDPATEDDRHEDVAVVATEGDASQDQPSESAVDRSAIDQIDGTADEVESPTDVVNAGELSEDELNIMLINGMWDFPSKKEPDLVEFLLDESDSVLMEIVLQSGILEHDPTNEEARQSLRRQFHTIKGSGRIAGVVGMAQVAWWVEHMLSEDEDGYPAYRPRVDVVVKSAHELFSEWFAELRSQGKIWIQGGDLRSDIDAVSLLDSLPSGEAPVQEAETQDSEAPELVPTVEIADFSMEDGASAAPVVVLDNSDAPALSSMEDEPTPDSLSDEVSPSQEQENHEIGHEEDTRAPVEDVEPQSEPTPPAPSAVAIKGLGEFDAEMFGLFEEDARAQVAAIEACLACYQDDKEVDVASLSRAAHTVASLAGGMGMQDLRMLARSVEKVLDVHPEDPLPADMILPTALAEASREISVITRQVYEDKVYVGVDESLAGKVDALGRVVVEEGADMAPDPVDLSVEMVEQDEQPEVGDEEDDLIDEIIDKMTEVTEKLQEATMLLVKLSERRR